MESLDRDMLSHELMLPLPLDDVASVRRISRAWLAYFDQSYWRKRCKRDLRLPPNIASLATRFSLDRSQVLYLCNVLCDHDQKKRMVPRPCKSATDRAKWHRAARFLGLFTCSVPTGLQSLIRSVKRSGYESYGETFSGEVQVRTLYQVLVANREDRLPSLIDGKDKDTLLSKEPFDSLYKSEFKQYRQRAIKHAKKKRLTW